MMQKRKEKKRNNNIRTKRDIHVYYTHAMLMNTNLAHSACVLTTIAFAVHCSQDPMLLSRIVTALKAF
jgi:hypothetical protein